VLSLENIYYRYENAQKYVLKDLNAQFEEGKFIAVVGKSGAGKSTFLSLLAGLDSPTKGKVLFKGEDIAKGSYSDHRREHICLVFQNYNLIDYLTPLENVKLVNEKADKEILLVYHSINVIKDGIININQINNREQFDEILSVYENSDILGFRFNK